MFEEENGRMTNRIDAVKLKEEIDMASELLLIF
jgi:hypothetical protein